jgi:phosphoribosyl-AMP cyclohydrolase
VDLSIDEILRELDFSKGGGLVPVVVQDIDSKEILMLGYANREAIIKTIESGRAHFWSRSRGRIWMKGETSGNIIEVIEIIIDCDGDTVIYLSKPTGSVCHTGSRSCFFRRYRIPRHRG